MFQADFGMNMCEYAVSYISSNSTVGGGNELALQMSKYVDTQGHPNLTYNKAKNFKNLTNDKTIDPAVLDDGFFIDGKGRTFFFEYAKLTPDREILECPMITVDINGYYQKPNRIGYDIFSFRPTADGRIIGMGANVKTGDNLLQRGYLKCDFNKKSDSWNGYGCTHYALTDQNPNNPNKKYWKNLH